MTLKQMPESPKYKIYTDGSFRKGAGAWGYIKVDAKTDEVVEERCEGAWDTTNNKMELEAIKQALASLAEDEEAIIYTDSQYGFFALTKWYKSWVRNNWMLPISDYRKETSEVKNKELLQSILELLLPRPIWLMWIRAHNIENDDSIETKFNHQIDCMVQEKTKKMLEESPEKSTQNGKKQFIRIQGRMPGNIAF